MTRWCALLGLSLALGIIGCGDDDDTATDSAMDSAMDVLSDAPERNDTADPPESCTPSGLSCPGDELCLRGGRCEGPGMCMTPPTDCPTPEPGDEVCGCDGTRYASTCLSNQAGVDTAFDDTPCL